MKKIIFFLCVVAFTFTSCSSDDDTPQNLTSIVGTWKYYKYFENNVEQTLEICETQHTLVFTSAGAFMSTFYEESINDPSTCVIEGQISGTWSNQGNVYTIISNGDASIITITLGVNTFTTQEVETYNGVTTTYKEVWKKQ